MADYTSEAYGNQPQAYRKNDEQGFGCQQQPGGQQTEGYGGQTTDQSYGAPGGQNKGIPTDPGYGGQGGQADNYGVGGQQTAPQTGDTFVQDDTYNTDVVNEGEGKKKEGIKEKIEGIFGKKHGDDSSLPDEEETDNVTGEKKKHHLF